jgi:hypothetical protein
VKRGVAWLAIAGSFAVGLFASHGCVDDRAKVKAAVFICNPSSPTVATDCGAGFMCYSAAQSLGQSVCVPQCDSETAAPCSGACTKEGACLTRCQVPDDPTKDTCLSPLHCRRISDSPFERASGRPDGVCLPVNGTCSSADDCTSPIFNGCTSEVTGASDVQPGKLLTSGEVCVESKCFAGHVACEPGSACIKAILPSGVPVPDVCSPVCGSIRDRKTVSGPFSECMPGLTCMSDAFPQTRANACAPGFPGWLCVDDVGCTAGACDDWGDLDGNLSQFLTCSPRCSSDADCVPFDRGNNPNFITHFTCQKTSDGDSWCRNLSSLFFPMTCLNGGDTCRLDDGARCVANPPASTDMGGVDPCKALDNGAMGLGALGGQAASCQRSCNTNADCATFSAGAHMPMTCQGEPGNKLCAPIVPFVTPCDGDGDCMAGLHCLVIDKASGRKSCTLSCSGTTDCAANNLLSSNFACIGAICTPKVQSGCPGGESDFCLSGHANADGGCLSPSGWACTSDAQCESDECQPVADAPPPFGRCK